MCDVGYLCANFSLPRPLCSRVRPDVRDRQTDRQTNKQTYVGRQTKASLNASAMGRRHVMFHVIYRTTTGYSDCGGTRQWAVMLGGWGGNRGPGGK